MTGLVVSTVPQFKTLDVAGQDVLKKCVLNAMAVMLR
jgi:hypothetical protein